MDKSMDTFPDGHNIYIMYIVVLDVSIQFQKGMGLSTYYNSILLNNKDIS